MAHTQKRRTFENFVRHLENNGRASPGTHRLGCLCWKRATVNWKPRRQGSQFLEARIAELEARDAELENQRAQPNEAERH